MKFLIAYLIIVILFIAGCSSSIKLKSELKKENNRYYYDNKPFTGVAISEFKNRQISDEVNFKNGLPEGKWKTYGYDGEVIQEGTYQAYYLRNAEIGKLRGIKRVNICTYKEGDINLIDVHIINNELKRETIKEESPLYQDVIDTLKSNHIVINASLVDNIIFNDVEM
jgi:hypothetical protein